MELNKMKNIIKRAKQIIDLPYNKFNLDNMTSILAEEYGVLNFLRYPDTPTALMSGNHPLAGIYKTPEKSSIYLIGKGILFDSGGMNLKRPVGRMYDDKAGAIVTLAVAKYFKNKIMAVCPITTNMIHQSLIMPYDQLKIGKKIVEITNTDAEGRLILAEAISYINASKKDTIITVATLTGCCPCAIDSRAVGVLSPSDKLANLYLESAKEAKEYAWRLPLFDYMQKDYNKKMIVNANDNIKAGTSEAAMFLKQFVSYPENWLHLDIASSAFDKKGKANGIPIRSLINFVKKLQ